MTIGTPNWIIIVCVASIESCKIVMYSTYVMPHSFLYAKTAIQMKDANS